MKIQNRIIKSEDVEWKKLKFIQADNFKELTKEAYEKLKNSILTNQFVESFKVWQNGNNLYCLDGFHRIKVLKELLKEGDYIPGRLRADFIECKTRKDAAKLVLIYSSIYAKISEEGLYEYLNKNFLDLNTLELEISIPEVNIEEFKAGFYEDIDIPEDFVSVIKGGSEYFSMTFVFKKTVKKEFEAWLKKNGKDQLTERIIKIVKGR